MATKPKKSESTAESNIVKFVEAIESDSEADAREAIKNEIEKILSKHKLDDRQFLILFDEHDSITKYHSDRIYAAASSLKSDPKDIILLVNSGGGRIEPAYLISKALNRLKADKFITVVPRRAKSAATLICLGADEIHLGMMSELGPIDPQIQGLPALALGNALDVIADLTCRFPEAAPLLGKYISEQAPIRVLGYFQRVTESAVQYAERLLQGKNLGKGYNEKTLADRLVNHYKDHSFVIDYDESLELFSGEVIKESTDAYNACDEIFRLLDFVDLFCRKNKDFWVVGDSAGFAWRNAKDE